MPDHSDNVEKYSVNLINNFFEDFRPSSGYVTGYI